MSKKPPPPIAAVNLWRDVLQNQRREVQPLKFWASGLPFCPRAFWLDQHLGPFFDTQTYQRSVHLAFANATHTHVQQWLGHTGQLWGNWSCQFCDFKKIGGFQPTSCPKHTYRPLVYEECRVTDNDFVGKVDAIVQLRTNDRWVVIELKTESHSKYLRRSRPETSHLDQANAYACLLNQDSTLSFKISEFWLWYFDRSDIATQPKMWNYTPKPARWKKIVAHMQKIKHSNKQDKIPKRRCHDKQDQPWCKARDACWMPQQHLSKLLREGGTRCLTDGQRNVT